MAPAHEPRRRRLPLRASAVGLAAGGCVAIFAALVFVAPREEWSQAPVGLPVIPLCLLVFAWGLARENVRGAKGRAPVAPRTRLRWFRVRVALVAALSAVGASLSAAVTVAPAVAGGWPGTAPAVYAAGVAAVATGAVLYVLGAHRSHRATRRASLAAGAAGVLAVALACGAAVPLLPRLPLDHTTAGPADPADPPESVSGVAWTWDTPEDAVVGDVAAAGGGAVVLLSDGVVALDGAEGAERWRYRRSGARVLDLAVSPDGATIVVTFEGTAPMATGELSPRAAVLDAATGEVLLEATLGTRDDEGPLAIVGDRTWLEVPTSSAAIARDLHTGEEVWAFEPPEGCRLDGTSGNGDPPVAVPGGYAVAVVCPHPEAESVPVLLRVAEAGGEESWRLEAPSGDLPWNMRVAAGPGGRLLAVGWLESADGEELQVRIVDAETGQVVAENPPGLGEAQDGDLFDAHRASAGFLEDGRYVDREASAEADATVWRSFSGSPGRAADFDMWQTHVLLEESAVAIRDADRDTQSLTLDIALEGDPQSPGQAQTLELTQPLGEWPCCGTPESLPSSAQVVPVPGAVVAFMPATTTLHALG